MVKVDADKQGAALWAAQGFAKSRQNETGLKPDEPKTDGSTK
jgi:hypothetical protein